MKKIDLLVRTSIILCAAFYTVSCREQMQEQEVITATESAEGRIAPEEAYPGETGVLKKGTLFGSEITYTEIDGKAVFQGDIILTPEQLGQTENARTQSLAELTSIWPNNTIPYEIDASVANADLIEAAIAEIEAVTPVRFVMSQSSIPQSPNFRPSYVKFTRSRGYSSAIGKVNGMQIVGVPLFATKGGMLHEICHTVGLYHEHNRGDRTAYIKINSENALESAQQQYFWKFSDNSEDPLPYYAFDFGSIMMMDSWAYSKNGKPVITTVDNKTFNVQRDHLSKNDINGIITSYSEVFAGREDNLYLADTTTGIKAPVWGSLPGEKKMFAIPGALFCSTDKYFFQIRPKSGRGDVISYNMANAKGMAYANDKLYVLQDGYIKTLKAPMFGDEATLGDRNWLAGTAMTYAYGFLFIINGNNLFRVSMNAKSFISMGTGYLGATEMVTLNDKIYVLKKDGKLYRIDPMTGVSTLLTNTTFSTTAQLTYNGKNLLVTSGDSLLSVSLSGAVKVLSSGWAGTRELVARLPE